MTALGVGSMDGQPRKEHVATLHSLAVRIATNSSRHTASSQTGTVGAPADRPPTHHNQTVLPDRSVSSRPVSKGTTPSEVQPSSIQPAPNVNIGTAPLYDQSVPANGSLQHPIQNGGPPEKITMPPVQIERMKTEYMTPPTDPSEIKTLQ